MEEGEEDHTSRGPHPCHVMIAGGQKAFVAHPETSASFCCKFCVTLHHTRSRDGSPPGIRPRALQTLQVCAPQQRCHPGQRHARSLAASAHCDRDCAAYLRGGPASSELALPVFGPEQQPSTDKTCRATPAHLTAGCHALLLGVCTSVAPCRANSRRASTGVRGVHSDPSDQNPIAV